MAGLKGVDHADEEIEKCLKLVGLWEEKGKKLKKYSGGMKRHKGIVTMRVISKEKPCETAMEAEENLEEVYLRLIGDSV